MNNLAYLKNQIKGYETDSNSHSIDFDERSNEYYVTADDDSDNLSIKLSQNGTSIIEFLSIPNANNNNQSNAIEYEASGDGDDEYEVHELNAENKFGFISIPNNHDSSNIINAQLQRLSQLVQSAENEKKQTIRLKPEQLNQLLSAQNFQLPNAEKYSLNKYSEPIPAHGMVDSNHLDQIIDLQNKLNKFVALKNELSTVAPPIQFVNGNGVFPSDATTVHIKATNNLKNPNVQETPYTSSQIVVNRPGGSVVFRLPDSNSNQADHSNENGHISEETLKRLLQLSQKMSNQAPNTPNFVHDLPHSGYYPVVQPILLNNNFPWNELKTLIAALQAKKDEKDEKPSKSAEGLNRVSTVNGVVQSDTPMAASAQDDAGPTTIVHTHIPITIAHPPISNTLLNRIHEAPVSTTARPYNRYDSYGQNVPTDEANTYQSYPPYSGNILSNGVNQQASSLGLPIYQSQQSEMGYNQNMEQPQYIKISQSRPDPYIPPPINTNAIMSQFARPIATYASINGGNTQRIDSPYAQTNNNQHVKTFVPADSNDMPSNYVPMYSSAPMPATRYSQPATMYTQNTQKLSIISDKMDQYAEPMDVDNEETYAIKSDEIDDYVQVNAEQMEEDNDTEDDDNDDGDENVMSLLANYNAQTKQELVNTFTDVIDNRPPRPPRPMFNANNKNAKTYVIFNGNIIAQDTFESSIQPYLQGSSQAQLEYLSCAKGVRQANTTDCTRYFVCDTNTGKILSYTCPPYTGFNADTKICNAETYSKCYPTSVGPIKTTTNKLLEQQALIEANRIKTEALKAQRLTQLMKSQTQKLLTAQQMNHVPNMGKATKMPTTPTKSSHLKKRPTRKVKTPPQRTANIKHQNRPTNKLMGKRKIPCRSEGKLADRLSKFHYFLCFKDATSTMRARRLQCPANLTFCESSLVCTQSKRCAG